MADGKPSILIYRDTLRLLLNSFGPEDFYAIMGALSAHAEGKRVQKPQNPAAEFAYNMIAQQHDRDSAAYAEKSKKRSAAARKRWEASGKGVENAEPCGQPVENHMQKHAKNANADFAPTDTVTVTDTVTDIEDDINISSSSGKDDERPVDEKPTEKIYRTYRELIGKFNDEVKYGLLEAYGALGFDGTMNAIMRAYENGGTTWKYVQRCINSQREDPGWRPGRMR